MDWATGKHLCLTPPVQAVSPQNYLMNWCYMHRLFFSLSDILNRFPVFSLGHAKLILEIFQELFEDIPYFDEMMATVAPNDPFFHGLIL